MPRPKALLLDKVCERCSSPFQVPDKANFRDNRFCSRSCSNRATAEQRGQSLSATRQRISELGLGGYVLPICACGEQIQPRGRSQYTYRKYCSDACRQTYGGKRQPDPNNYITFDCQTCGKSVTRYKKHGNGASKFCSNECAAKHTRIKVHYAFRDSDVVLDSTWEGLVYCLLRYLKIPVERVDRKTAIEWSEGHWYAPDFYLPALDLYLEVKGLEDNEDEARWLAWNAQVGKVIVIDYDLLDQLRRLDRDAALVLLGLCVEDPENSGHLSDDQGMVTA